MPCADTTLVPGRSALNRCRTLARFASTDDTEISAMGVMNVESETGSVTVT
jgi:hypothetical protein